MYERYKIVSEKRAVDSAELSETLLDDEPSDQSLTACLRVYDVEKLADDVGSVPSSVSKLCFSDIYFYNLCQFIVNVDYHLQCVSTGTWSTPLLICVCIFLLSGSVN